MAPLRQYKEENPSDQSFHIYDAGLLGNPIAAQHIQDHAAALLALLAGRDDRAAILAAATAQLVPSSSLSVEPPSAEPGIDALMPPLPPLPPIPQHREPPSGMAFEDMHPMELYWCEARGSPSEVMAARTALRMCMGEALDDKSVEFVRSVTWTARDAALRADAVQLPSFQSPIQPKVLSLTPDKPTEEQRVKPPVSLPEPPPPGPGLAVRPAAFHASGPIEAEWS